MTREQAIKEVFTATLISVLLFILVAVASYFITLENRTNFSIGFPWKFYTQSLVDCNVQHGSRPVFLVMDAFLLWLVTVIAWLFLRRTKYL